VGLKPRIFLPLDEGKKTVFEIFGRITDNDNPGGANDACW